MLLQRLKEFAERAADQLPAEYYRPRTIHWVLRIAEDGSSAELEGGGPLPPKQRDQALVEQVPYVQRSGTKVPPYLLVDSADFVLGVPKVAAAGAPAEKAAAEAGRRHDAWRDLALAWAEENADDPAAVALRRYLVDPSVRWPVNERVSAKDVVALRVGMRWLHPLPSVRKFWAEVVRQRKGGSEERSGLCLVCGTHAQLLATIPEPVKKGSVPTVGGSNEGQLVSINAASQGRRGITQLGNTPICHTCGGRSMASLNHLLASERHSRRFREDGVLLWWTREGANDDALDALLHDKPDEADIARLVDSINDAPRPTAAAGIDADAFYGLTLGLNNARIVVRDWIDVPVDRVLRAWGRWFDHSGAFDGWNRVTRWTPIWLMALSCGRWDGERYAKGSAPHGLEHDLLRSALHENPLPAHVLPLLLQRIQADQRIDTPRVALLRLILNRPFSQTGNAVNPATEKLNEDSTDAAYTAGRMFYVLEEVQRSALENLNTSLRDKHFRTAMVAPLTTMTQLVANANAHFKRLERDNPKAGRALLDRLTQLQSRLDTTLPQHLAPDGQARFVLGYYHQRQSALEAMAAARNNGEGDGGSTEGT
ncbi:type I-C CRISPR-associated protein Cas8c/Csd1 [Streptomyces durbertensis]|uniref:Type I-C CRISPR-associated protein Cas8c/Csd1 n=1 Tax=Streptomyces durbertensis TaxID=2448886 RepID=A0ABR6EL50_9ACTN|nr:type I-C CRISPR-associated protein Cas8c/Csd1 [Streptomyces durbertensis]MBB1245264.1 type I-C CRISPR-associated protein Cas8c/Csd1 [Streptomyces durbertensis]